MEKPSKVGQWLTGVGVLVASLTLVLYLWHEKDHERTDYTVPIIIAALVIVSVGVSIWATIQNLKDAHRADSLHAQIITIKEEHKLRMKASEVQIDNWSKQFQEQAKELNEQKALANTRLGDYNNEVQARQEALSQVEALKKRIDEESRISCTHSPELGGTGDFTLLEIAYLLQISSRWERLFEQYRRLDYDNREHVRLPLSQSSWPDFGKSWDYIHARLYTLRERFSDLYAEAEIVLKMFRWNDWDDARLPRVEDSIVMVDLLGELREFGDYLKGKLQGIQSSVK